MIYANMTRNYTKISIPENILYRKVGDESVIVNLESGKNYSSRVCCFIDQCWP